MENRKLGSGLFLEPGFVAKVFHLNRKRFHRCPQVIENQFVEVFTVFYA